ncbi:MAG: zinc-binding dehydrogenase, partial [Candidatus Korarchaeota archaeon]|nr:zinc-binding dehydrogenase [Candidatus Korarchaeota archaeon]
DNTIVIGLGGVGSYMAQELKALGANIVIGIDISEVKLQKMLKYGVDEAINATGKSPKDVANEVKAIRKKYDLPAYGWKIFECTGTKPGQETALNLLSFIGKLIIVGFGMQKVEYSISRLMAFDAEIIGTWGCLPEYYPAVLSMVVNRKINIEDFVQTRPMSQIAEVFEEVHKSPPEKRVVLVPDFK